MSNVLLDTNILLDYVLSERPESDSAVQLFRAIFNGDLSGFVAASSLNDFYYVVRKFIGDQAARVRGRAAPRCHEARLQVNMCVSSALR